MDPITRHEPDELLGACLINVGTRELRRHMDGIEADTEMLETLTERLADGRLHLRIQAAANGEALVNLIHREDLPLGDGIPIATTRLSPADLQTLATGLGYLLAKDSGGTELWAKQQRGEHLLGVQVETSGAVDNLQMLTAIGIIVFR